MRASRLLVLAVLPCLSAACVASTPIDASGDGDDVTDDLTDVVTLAGCDVLVVGGGTGGVAAAHEAASLGAHVCLTEETEWLGGQFTTQAVPLDTGWHDASLTMTAYLDAVRASYHQSYPGWPSDHQNPGECGREICFEPSVGEGVLEAAVLGPLVQSGKLRVFKQYRPISVTKSGNAVVGVTFRTGTQGTVYAPAKITIDATEFGDLLPATMEGGPGANARYRIGRDAPNAYSPRERDAQYEWDQNHTPWPAGDTGDSECTQRLTYVFDVQYLPNDVNPGDPGVPASAPPGYDPSHYCPTWPTRCTLDVQFDTSGECDGTQCKSWWNWRRVKSGRRLVGDLSQSLAPDGSADPAYQDITSINYFHANDFAWDEAWCGPYGCDPAEQGYAVRQAILGYARDFSLGYFWYLRNDVLRPDGHVGYKNLRTRPSV
ncbi:MAG TPA: FAD-dependent oxidoreductase, partial [Minicystis sp.]|nr:FAD-dependent oxidoreductase [Minicystis sp.]